MRNLLLITLSVVLFMGCDRLKFNDNTKIQIQLPAAPSEKGGVSTTSYAGNSSPEPTGFTGAATINCYLVAAAGPEADLSKNKCFSRDGVNSSFADRKVGRFVGAIPIDIVANPNSTVSIDVPSGTGRSIMIVGFHAANTADCRDFKAYGFPEGTLSHPYWLGEATGLELLPGETKNIDISMSFNANNVIDCEGPDFPEGNGGAPKEEASHIAADFYHSVGLNQCHPMRVHLYKDVAGVQNYNVKHSTSHNISLPASGATVMGLSFYANETDCQGSTGSISSLTLPVNSVESTVWFKASAPSGSGPVALSFTSSGLTYAQSRTLYATSATSPSKLVASPSDSIRANECREYVVNVADASGVATSAADSTMNVQLKDLSDNVLNDNRVTFVNNCTARTPLSGGNVTIDGTKLRVNFGILTTSSILMDFKLVFTAGSLAAAETLFNITPLAPRLKFDIIKTFPDMYTGDCLRGVVSLVTADGVTPFAAPSAFNVNANMGIGATLTHSLSCGGTATSNVSFAASDTSKEFGFKINGTANGSFSYDLFSPYVTTMFSGTYSVKETPVAQGAIVHAVAEGLDPMGSPMGWMSSAPMGSPLMMLNFSAPIATSDIVTNKANGIIAGPSAYMSVSNPGSSSTSVIFRYKWSGTPDGDLITTNDGTYSNAVGIASGVYTLYGASTSIPANANVWTNIGFTLDGSTGNCYLYVQEVGGSVSQFNTACHTHTVPITQINIGPGTTGNVKTVSIFNNQLPASQVHGNANSVFNYMTNRYP